MSVNTISAEIKNLEEQQKLDEEKLAQARKSALQEAWLVNQKEMRQLPQSLSAQGMNGGAVQSSYADIANAYQKARGNYENEYAKNLADSRLKYSQNLLTLKAKLADAQEAAARAAAARRSYGYGGKDTQKGFKSWNSTGLKKGYVNPHGVMTSSKDYYNAIPNESNRPRQLANPYTYETSLNW